MHEEGTFLEQYIHLLQNSAHWLFEITVQVVIDLVILYLGYKILWKRVIVPKVRRDVRKEIDQHHDDLYEIRNKGWNDPAPSYKINCE